MIGNDVVDLAEAAEQSNWRRKGFLEKVFSPEEEALIRNSEDPHKMVWLLWSMKEAAYKAHQRRFDLRRRLSWRDLICSVEKNERGEVSGKVEHQRKIYFTFSEITQHFIHTTTFDPSERGSKKLIFEASSEAMKQEFLQDISKDFSVERELLCLQKNSEGIPTVYCKNQPFFTAFSLSSHGKYAAFSRALMNC